MKDKKTGKEEVRVFGKKESEWDREWGRNDQGGAGGIILITAGVLLLMNTLEWLPWTVWNEIWRWWPVLLILAGIKVMLGRSKSARLLVTIMEGAAVVLVAAFAVYMVRPETFPNLPEWLENIFSIMKGLKS